MAEESVRLQGHLLLEVTTPGGRLVARTEATNTVVDGGRNLLAALLGGAAANPVFRLTAGVEDRATAPDLTKLFEPDGLEPVLVKQVTVKAGTLLLSGAFEQADKEREISEAGLMLTCETKEERVSTLYNRALVKPAQVVRKGEILTLTWSLTFASSHA